MQLVVLHLENGTKCLGHTTLWYYWQAAEYGFLGRGRKHFQQVPCRFSKFRCWDFAVGRGSCATVSRKINCGELSRAKWARVLSQNQIREIVMNSDNDEKKHYASADMEDNEEPQPPSRSSSSQPPSPDFSASSSEDEDDDGIVEGQQPHLSQWTLPPKRQRGVMHTFTGAPKREKQSSCTHDDRVQSN
jgi:hypothetical protein